MARALIIAGDSRRFGLNMREARRTLRYCSVESVRTIYGAYKEAADLQRAISDFLAAEPLHQDIRLLLYLGHGSTSGWCVNEETCVEYSFVLERAAACRGPVIVVNDCCHAGTCIDLARQQRINDSEILIFAACSAEEISYGGLTKEIVNCWRQGNIFEPGEIIIDLIEIYDPWVEAGNPACSFVDGLWQINSIHNAERKVGERREPSPFIRWGAPLDAHFFPHV